MIFVIPSEKNSLFLFHKLSKGIPVTCSEDSSAWAGGGTGAGADTRSMGCPLLQGLCVLAGEPRGTLQVCVQRGLHKGLLAVLPPTRSKEVTDSALEPAPLSNLQAPGRD